MSKKKKVEETVRMKTTVNKYITKSITFETTTALETDDEESDYAVRLSGIYEPERKTINIQELPQLGNRDIPLQRLLTLACALIDLVSEIKRKEHLRNLAEGFGDSIEAHKAKKSNGDTK